MEETKEKTGPGQDFAAFFAAEIAPALPELEAARKDLQRAAYTRAAGVALVTALAAGIAVAFTEQIALAIPVVGICALSGYYWIRMPGQKHRRALRALVVEPLRRFLGGLQYHRDPGDRFDLSRFERSGVTAHFDKAKLEDLLIGRYRDTDYRMVEARLKKRKGGSRNGDRSVFSGLLCEISVPVPFSCTVLLIGDKGKLGNWVVDLVRSKVTNLTAVPLDHEAFEARYQVYSDEPEGTRRLLQPGLLESLLALSDRVGRRSVNCAFMDGRFLIAIPHAGDLFEIGRLGRSLDHAEEDLRRLAVEFTIPQRLVDYLYGDRPPLFPED